MSGILGIFRRDGAVPLARDLERMMVAQAAWGPDGQEVWQRGPMAMGQHLLVTTPEAARDFRPLLSEDRETVLVAAARLDNREELLRELEGGPGLSTSPPYSDNRLILAAFLRWGDACASRLLGDWSFALWDSRRRRLLLARDPTGNTALHYYQTPELLAFATSLKALLALPQVPRRPSQLQLAQILTCWPGDGSLSSYQDLRRLPPAHRLWVMPEATEMRRYWRVEDSRSLSLSEDESAEAMLSVLSDAVRARLRCAGSLAATLSGGLDSGAVCALAARELERKQGRLRAFVSVPSHPTEGLVAEGRFGEEGPLALATAHHAGNIDTVLLRAEGVSPLEGIRRLLAVTEEPGHAAGNWYWLSDLLTAAQDYGTRVLLTGQGGNGTLSWTPSTPAGGMGDLQELRGIFEASGALPAVKHALRPWVYLAKGQCHRLLQGREPWREYSFLRPELGRALELTDRMRAAGHDPCLLPPARVEEQRSFAASPPAISALGVWHALGAGHGLEVRDPTLDRRLVELCWGIPLAHFRKAGETRRLARRALVGLLPDAVRLNMRRGYQAADVAPRLLDAWEDLSATLGRFEASPLVSEYLDVPRMQAEAETLRQPMTPKTTSHCGALLLRAVAVGLFLLRFDP